MKFFQVLLMCFVLLFSNTRAQSIKLTYQEMGWTKEEAAAHLLNRLAYGPTPGQVDQVAGDLSGWVKQQINASEDTSEMNQRIYHSYSAEQLSLEQISQTYPAPGVRLIFMAMQRGGQVRGMNNNQVGNRQMMLARGDSTRPGASQNDLFQRIVNAEPSEGRYQRFTKFTEKRFGWQDFSDLFYQLMSKKLEMAIHSPNQLQEIMVDFWFNHFNVSIHGVNDMATQVYSFERDAIRPHALGNFRDLLGAVAKHPAMLLYLDNNRSNAAEERATLMKINTMARNQYKMAVEKNPVLRQFGQQPGVNENFARELLELHTLGVDGGYTQKDVEEIARAFTGWKVSPFIYPIPDEFQTRLESWINASPQAVLQEGFYFDPSRHDAEEKMILGEQFPAGRGVEEGERILDILAAHPGTARFISRKLAEKFVSDAPPESLIETMSSTFLASNGDIQKVLTSMIMSEEFWQKENKAAKIKTPLEVVVSAVRITGAEVTDYRSLIRRCTRMGQPLYAFQAPTGYPENSAFWTNGSALVNRMNFANDLSSGQIKGVEIDLSALNHNQEPPSESEALSLYLDYFLPQRNTRETRKLLLPVLNEPANISEMAEATIAEGTISNTPTGLAKIAGLVLGSPEFQRQ